FVAAFPEGVNRPITLSAGVTGKKMKRNSLMTELIQQADEALYKSKANGRNRITIFNKNLAEIAV
ncbi:MAG: hypothetical protein B0D92_00600, partial [Spirochaeta sp. LUC14_002_19_P3]